MSDTAAIAIAFIAVVPAIFNAVLTMRNKTSIKENTAAVANTSEGVKNLEIKVNGRFDQILKLKGVAEYARGLDDAKRLTSNKNQVKSRKIVKDAKDLKNLKSSKVK